MTTRITITQEECDNLATNLVAYLYRHGLEPAEMDHQCWLSRGMVSKILRGKSVPSNATLAHIARGMGITRSQLLLWDPTHECESAECASEYPQSTDAPSPPYMPLCVSCEDDEYPPEEEEDAWHDASPIEDITEMPKDASEDLACDILASLGENALETPLKVLHGPYLVLFTNGDAIRSGINLSQVMSWIDDSNVAMLTLTMMDGTQKVLVNSQRDVMLTHIMCLIRSAP